MALDVKIGESARDVPCVGAPEAFGDDLSDVAQVIEIGLRKKHLEIRALRAPLLLGIDYCSPPSGHVAACPLLRRGWQPAQGSDGLNEKSNDQRMPLSEGRTPELGIEGRFPGLTKGSSADLSNLGEEVM